VAKSKEQEKNQDCVVTWKPMTEYFSQRQELLRVSDALQILAR
jgi:hypothetical protein